MQLRIPDVTLIEELGRGPGSIVFRGMHNGSLCTVKLPSDRPAPSSESQANSFEQDILRLARLGHAGLPRVLQLGATAETPYAILDSIEGEPLFRVLEGELSGSMLAKFALTLARCVDQLHQAGFVHGSLTVENILLSRDGTRVRLVDTGSISRRVPFDGRVDTAAMGVVLEACLERSTDDVSSSLVRIVQELVAG